MQISPTKAKAELCRRSLYRFVQEFWSEIIPEDPVWNWHIKYLCDELQKDILRICRLPAQTFEGIELPAKGREPKLHDDLINIPPGTSKSTIVTVMAPAWVWSVDPTIRTITASYSGDLAIDHAVKSRDIIQSEKYRKYFPEVEIRADHNNKSNYKNTKGGERYATSTGGTITGIHAHLILCDDLINAKQASSDSELEAACSFLDTTLSTRKVDKAVTLTVLVMQRLHEKDPAGNWLKKMRTEGKKIRHICLPATLQYDKDGNPNCRPASLAQNYVEGLLDPVRMSKEVLEGMKVDLGSYGYSGQMQQDPSPAGGGIWQEGWIIPVPDHEFPSRRELEDYGTGWDTAYTEKLTNAASAYLTSGRKDNKMYIDAFGWYHKEFPDLINTMRLHPDPHFIEGKASGKSAIQTLVTAGITAIEVFVKGDKIMRARDASPKAEAGMIFCRASLLPKLLHDTEQGILKFPNGLRADLADVLAQEIERHFAKAKREVCFGW